MNNEDNEVHYTQLVRGNEYKIVCPYGTRNGRFIRYTITAVGPQVFFNNVSDEPQRVTQVTVQGNQCRFYKSQYSKMVENVGESKQLPPNLQAKLAKYGGYSKQIRRSKSKVQKRKKLKARKMTKKRV